jgi:hypothetical protein
MYNKTKVFSGLTIFLTIATFPFWKNLFVSSENRQIPQAVLAAGLMSPGMHCVEDRAFMRAKHMTLLDNWRNEVVRENKKIYINSRGEHFQKSLTGTCLKCHSNKEEFCDNCHKSVGVKPYCFDCHQNSGNTKTDHRDTKTQSKLFLPSEKQIAKRDEWLIANHLKFNSSTIFNHEKGIKISLHIKRMNSTNACELLCDSAPLWQKFFLIKFQNGGRA